MSFSHREKKKGNLQYDSPHPLIIYRSKSQTDTEVPVSLHELQWGTRLLPQNVEASWQMLMSSLSLHLKKVNVIFYIHNHQGKKMEQ